MKFHAREADHAVLVDIPLLVVTQAAAGAGDGLEESVHRRRSAPFQMVALALHEIPEAAGIAGLHAIDAGTVGLFDGLHFTLAGARFEPIAVAPSHVRHID